MPLGVVVRADTPLMTWLVPPDSLAAYLGAAVALVLLPGPAQALVLARSVERGARAGVITALGLDAATIVHAIAAALGLSAILAASATAFTAVKVVGAAYLVWLGVRMIRPRRAPAADAPSSGSARASAGGAAPGGAARLLAHGFITGVLNPKVALFFLAFLPQFVRPERGHVVAQFLLLGGILALLDLLWATVLALAVARARARVARTTRFAAWRERLTGGVLIALGVRLALTRR